MALRATRRPRALSGAERALWQAWLSLNGVAVMPWSAPPAVPDPPPPANPPPGPAAPPDPRAAAPERPVGAPATPPARAPLPALHVGAAPPGLDAARWKDLRRGRMRPERTLDLHGRRAQDAHDSVLGFLRDAHADGIRCVAIVTGKGSRAAPGEAGSGGVLRRELPFWLNLPALRPLVLGAAHPHAANPGAVHLLLRRRPAAPGTPAAAFRARRGSR